MLISLEIAKKQYMVDLDKPLNISIPLNHRDIGPNCFQSPPYNARPVRMGSFVGSTAHGSPVNFYSMELTPHGNGTHTECLGHIDSSFQKINEQLKSFHFIADLIDIYPQLCENGDRIISLEAISALWSGSNDTKALIIRTLPNSDDKKRKQYSGTNPPYFSVDAIEYIVRNGIQHLLIDLPSVDREKDDGKVAAHKAFWHSIGDERNNATITELIYVDDAIKCGKYFLNIQVLNITLDASPSQIILYPLREKSDE